jgi:glutamine synthetase
MAGIDGILNKIDPGEPKDVDLYELPAAEKALIKQVPSSLDAVLNALEADHDFLLKGGVFTPDLLEEYIKYKRTHEVDAIRLRPTPHEYVLYFDA